MLLKELTPEESLKTLQNRTPTQSINTTSKPKIVYSTPPKEGLLPKITNTIKGITTANWFGEDTEKDKMLQNIAWGDWSFNASEEKNKNINADIAYLTASKLPQYQNPNKNLSSDKNLSGFYYSTNPYDKMTDSEKNTFLNLYNTNKNKATDYLNSISTSLNERNLGENSQAAKFYKDWGSKNPNMAFAHNAISGVADFGSGFIEPLSALSSNKDIDKNAWVNASNKAREWVAEGATEDMSAVGKFLFNTGTSIAQTALRLPFGTSSLPLAGLSAGSQAAYDAAQRGATPSKALLSGTTSGIVEGIMEKIPLDSLRVLKNAPPDAARSLAKVLLKQSGIEATEETLTEFTNALLDKAIMGDKSNFALTKNQYMQNGLNDTDAGTRAYFDTFFKQPAIAGLGGALSGGVMGAGGYKLNQLKNNRINNTKNTSNVESGFNINQNIDTTPNTALQEVSNNVSTIPNTEESTVKENFMEGKSEISSNQEMTLDRYRRIKKYITQLKANGENIPEIKRLSKIIEDADGYIEYYNAESAGNVQKAANKLVKELGNIYSFSSRKNTQSSKEVLNAIKRITANIKENDNFSTDDIRLIEETAFDQGFVKNIDEIKRNEGAKSWIKGLRLYVSPEVKASISDYNDFRKSTIGKIGGLTTTDVNATSIDTAYQELHGMYPDLFPDAIINEVEQLERIKEVADSLVIRKTPLSEAWQNSPDGSYTRLKNAARSELMTALESYRKSVLNESNKAWNKAFERYNEDVKKGRFGKDYSTAYNIPDNALVDVNETNNEISAGNEVSENIENTSEEEGSVLDFLFEDENTPFGQNTVGSAEYNPNSLQSLGERYGVIEAGEEPISTERVVQIPKSIDGKTKVSKTARTAAENPYFDNDMENSLEQEILSGSFNYTPETNANLMKDAEDTLKRLGFDGALSHWRENINDGKAVTDKDIALITRLINEAADAKNTNLTMELLAEYAAVGTRIGKAMQAQRLLKRSTPTGQLYYIQKTIDNYNNSNKSRKRSNREVTLNQELASQFLNAPDEATREKIAEQMYLDVAEQLPFSWLDQWNSWRYFAMLANPRTHMRNLFGNVIFAPVRMIKNTIGASIESSVDFTLKKAGKEGIRRTKTLNHFSDAYKANYEFAKELFDSDYKVLMGEAKYGINDKIQKAKNQVPFKLKNKNANKVVNAPFKAFNKLADTNSKALEYVDKVFFKQAFVESLASFMTANNMNSSIANIPRSKADSELYNRAIDYATKEAQKATYRDESALAKYISEFGRKGKIANFLVEAVIPFKKTPINIVKRGFEYSPGGLIKGMGDAFTKVRNGEMEAAEAIDEIAAGLTGTGIVALGAFFASKGIINGIGEEEKKLRELENSEGYQNYSLNIGDYSYTIDWSAPVALPLFVGVELYSSMKEDNADFSFDRFVDAYTKISEPMFNLSVISGFRDFISNNSYSDEQNIIWDKISTLATNYLGQAVPTLFGQIARTIDDTSRTYYPNPNSSVPPEFQRFLQQQQAKIPIANQSLEPYLDVWGNEDKEDNILVRAFENFISPGYLSKRNTDNVNTELKNLYNTTGETDVLPSKPQKYSTVNDIRKDYTAEEYTRATKLKGQTAYNSIKDIMGSNIYNNMTPEQKRDVITDIYEYSNAITRDELDDNYEVSSWINKINNGVKETGMSAGELMLYRDMINAITEGDKRTGKSKVQLQDELIYNLNVSPEVKNWLSKNFVTRGSFIPDTETVVDHSSYENFVITQLPQSAQKLYDNFAWQFLDHDADTFVDIYNAIKEGDKDEKTSRLLNMGYPPDFVETLLDLRNNPEKLTP